jgi:hypothetical protein
MSKMRMAGLSLLAAGALWAGVTARIVNIATDETDPRNLDDSEPSIAVNPLNPLEIAVVSFSERWPQMAPVWKSDDGGYTWRKVFQIPPPRGGAAGPDDQAISFNGEGYLFVAEQDATATVRNVIFRQTDGPDDPLTAGQIYGYDQPQLSIDKNPNSGCYGQLYSPWLSFSFNPEKSMVSSSGDGGAAMLSIRLAATAAFPNRTTRTAVAPDGLAYAIYKTREGTVAGGFENAHFRVHRSDDCGAAWDYLGPDGVSVHGDERAQTFFTTTWGNSARGKVARARSSDAWIAVDPSDGDVYAAYVHRDDSGFGQIYVARSTDFGATWASTRVTDGTHHSAYPEIAVADNGAIGVLYVDYDDSGVRNIYRHHFARSFDDGATWTDQVLSSSDPTPIRNARNGFLWGDYNGLTAFENTFYGVFTADSTGRSELQFDPIFFAETAEPPAR